MAGPDPRLYGLAPVERDVQNGVMMLTMVGVMKRLNISESTLRRNPTLMAMRKVLGPGTYRWSIEDIDRYIASLTPDAKPTKRQRAALHAKRPLNQGKQRDRDLRALMAAKLEAYRKYGAA